jgi:hypothetical protein
MEKELDMKFSDFRDCGTNAFDPLDLGIDDDEGEGEYTPRRGRPKSSILDRSRASYWAWSVRNASGKSFAELEREVAQRQFPKRAGGGFEQTNAWLKYANGERCPLPPSKGDKSPVVQAEKQYPGTKAVYDSIVWDLMYDHQTKPTRRLKLTSRISPIILNQIDPKHIEEKDQYRILLNPEGISNLVFARHLDAFGILLMQWRNLDWERVDISLIYIVRTWLLFSFQWMEPFVTCRRLMANLIHHNVNELGLLNGPMGLDPKKTHDERASDAFYSALFGGVAVEMPSSALYDVFPDSK